MISPADYLEIITRPGRYVLFEKGASELPRCKNGIITIKDADGSGGIEMSTAVFDDFCAKGFLRQDGTEDEQHREIFLATEDAHTAQSASKKAADVRARGRCDSPAPRQDDE